MVKTFEEASMKYYIMLIAAILYGSFVSCKQRENSGSGLAGNAKKNNRLEKEINLDMEEFEKYVANSKLPEENCKVALIDISDSSKSGTLVFFDQKSQYRRDFTVSKPAIKKIKQIKGFDNDIPFGLIEIENTSFLNATLGYNQEKRIKLYINLESKSIAGLEVKFPISDIKAKSQICGTKPEVLK